ncbi:MAG: peptidase S66 [Rhodothermaceae bacterium]|nr:MAG: peptidase S66 [Rhodothermaceae bacterium]
MPAPPDGRVEALRPGDLVGVVAPGSAPADDAALAAGIERLAAHGFRVEVAPNVRARHGYLAGPDSVRLAAFNTFLRRPDVKALFCARGGYGSLRLLPDLDYEAARRHPKLLVGYSDVTALHLALYHRAGWRGLSGPMVAVEWGHLDAASERLFFELARGHSPDPLLGPGGETLTPVRPGTAEGLLLGGNLAVLTRLIGTPYLPSLEGAILFLEDVGEAPYRLDGLLAHLRLAGLLDRLGGVVLGGFTECDPPPDRPSLSLEQVFDDYFGRVPYPVARGLVYGHFPVKNTVPVGVRARLTVTDHRATLGLLEPAVRVPA